MIEFHNEECDYRPLTKLFAYKNGELVHRSLVHKGAEEAELRAEIERRHGAGCK